MDAVHFAILAGIAGLAPAQTWQAPAFSAQPGKAPPAPPVDWIKGQIPDAGGAIQYYLNVGRVFALHEIFPPFAGNFVRPLANGRVEIFGGAAGIYVPVATALTRPNAWLAQGNLGARMSIDTARLFWIGTSTWYLADFADKKRQRAYQSADLTIQFGR